jgi:hypothetical protein
MKRKIVAAQALKRGQRNARTRISLHHGCCKELPVVQKKFAHGDSAKKNFKKDFRLVSTGECLC